MGCGKSADDTGLDKLNEYSNEDYGFRFLYPESWMEENCGIPFLFAWQIPGGEMEIAVHRPMEGAEVKTLEQTTETFLDTMKRAPDYEHTQITQGETTLGGEPAVEVASHYTSRSGKTGQKLTVITKKDGMTYLVGMRSSSEEYAHNLDSFQEVLKSFEFVSSPEE